jgi:hypothetical protein
MVVLKGPVAACPHQLDGQLDAQTPTHCSEKGVRLAQTIQVGPRIPARIQL